MGARQQWDLELDVGLKGSYLVVRTFINDLLSHDHKGVIVNISGGNDMTLLEVDHAANIIRQSVNPEANIIFGQSSDPTLKDEVRLTAIISSHFEVGKSSIGATYCIPELFTKMSQAD